MKKVLFALFALVLCMGMTSCGGPDLKSLAEKAEKEGANWTEDQWKDNFKEYAKCLAPMLKDMQALGKKFEKAESDEDRDKIKKEEDELEKKYKDLMEASEKFEKAAKASENGKKVFDDKEFRDKVLKDLGIEDL